MKTYAANIYPAVATVESAVLLPSYVWPGKPNQVRYVRRDNSPLLVSAPHAVRHYHGDRRPDKRADGWTGGLCDLLGELLDCSSLSAASFVSEWQSWDTRSDDFKQALDDAIAHEQFVIDLHGMSDDHDADVIIGLGPQPSQLVTRIAKDLSDMLQPLNVRTGKPFEAKSARTVTSYVQSRGGDGLQIEIAMRLRDPASNSEQATAFLETLLRALRAI